ncbi:MAG: AMP-binding protein [Lachnospiraceae bacterium]|nr:AMP-binding protein [Lachnospiraceae bacterium]MBR4574010.1 AMP-binding protein [Lachnospiraceae bacterium]
MRLSFSTRGWRNISWEKFTEIALEMDFSGIEVYKLIGDKDLFVKGEAFSKYNIAATTRYLRDSKLTIPVFDGNYDLSDPSSVEDIKKIIGIAGYMHVDNVGIGTDTEDEDVIRSVIGELLPLARENGVSLLIETEGIYSDTKRLCEMLDDFADDNLAALWDLHHTYRIAHEEPKDTIRNLGAYVRHVHLCDSDDENTYNLIGEGSAPVREFMDALYSIDYAGFISLEWKPEYMEDLSDYSVIFPYFANYMSRFENTRGKKKKLYPNHDGTGQYVWKKDELIDLTFPQVLERMVEEFPDQYCFKYTTLDYTRTYEEFQKDVNDFAKSLMSLGVRSGSKVAVWATNVPAWYISFWACCKIGAVLVTMNTAYKIHEAKYLLRQSDTHTLIMIESAVDSNYKDIINELCPEIASSKAGEPLHCKTLPFLRNVITVGFSMPGALTFEEAMGRCDMISDAKLGKMAANVRPDDVCNMQYTSGTTGFPKGVMLTHYNVVNNGKCIGDRMGLSTADRMMIQVPMFHCFGMVLSMTSSITHGATICPMPYFSAKSSLACINQERITCFNGVPTMFIAMFNHEDYKKTDFSYMRTGIMAGAGCPPELMKRAAQPDEMNMRGIVSVYGQTETAPGNTMSSWTDPLDVRTETVGYAFPHVECKVIDPETGEEVGPGQNGEFCARGYNTMKGYYKMPEATRETIDENGWLHSGDLAAKDENGNYRITGRLKDMIIRGGENLYPKEIEEFIYTCPKVKDVQVIGVPDKRYGEEAMACIILKDGEKMTVEEMDAFIKASLARHKVPKYIEFVDEFPMNAAGKVLKYKMREDAVKRLGL